MSPVDSTVVAYGVPLALSLGGYLAWGRLRERRALAAMRAAEAAGLTEPASLHPVIDPSFCIGCGSCVNACPEGRILGLVGGKARLVSPSSCIGHGACARSCPMQAITLVFGTATRGVDIPHVGEDFQTNVPGIYIAGELGGMGLIRNAIEQGRQAMQSIIDERRPTGAGVLDVVVVGAGPAGISASLAAKQAGLNFVTLEQDSLGGTVAHFPRGKLVMTAPAELPIYGRVHFRETSKEALLEFWQGVVRETGLDITYGERVDGIERDADTGLFRVKTQAGTHEAGAVLLCIGRRGTPRKLGVPGEEATKVVYRLSDPEQYAGRAVLVVGGGDSALEAALSVAEVADTDVTLSYRGDAFSRAKPKNRDKVEAAARQGRLRVLLGSNVTQIAQDTVSIDQNGSLHKLDNDAVIVCAGGILPTGFLKAAGVEVETKYGTA